MSYAQFGLIQASDYNSLVGGNPTTTANTLNAVWATGSGGVGYGQTAAANVSAGASVAATNWATLINNTSSAASHQGATLGTVTTPTSGGTVTYQANVVTNLQTIYGNRLNAAAQGSTTANTTTTGGAWTDTATFTFTVTFANGDAARYFFNAGGQIKMTASHPNNTAGINAAFNSLASATGTIVVSGQNSGSRTIVGTSYNGLTKVGGSGDAVANSALGYFGLTTNAIGGTNTLLLDQNYSTSPYSGLVEIQYRGNVNGVQGSNGDNGTIVRIVSTWNSDTANTIKVVGSGSAVTCTAVPPSQTNIANTWGAITIAGSVVTANV